MEIVKVYVTATEGNKRVELKFKEVPTAQQIEDAFDAATQPVPEPNMCPMNDTKCPNYRKV